MVALPLLLLVGSAVGLTDRELADALSGKMPTRTEAFIAPSGKAAGRGVGAVVIDRPLADVWATLARYEDRADYLPRVKESTVLERRADKLRVHFTVDATIMTARYTAWFQLDEANHVISWNLDPTATDNSIVATDGEYRLFEVSPTETLVVYRAYVDSGRKVPRAIQEYFARKAIGNTLRAIKKRVESGGTWTK